MAAQVFEDGREDCDLLHDVTGELARRHAATTKFVW
jgi:hypothetical protein